MSEAKMTELTQAEDMAYFRADLCCYSPESYSLEEKKEICNDMISTSKAVLDAMREDFEQLPPTPVSSFWTCSAPPASRVPSGGGTFSWATETRCTASSNPSARSSLHRHTESRSSQ